MNVSERNQLRNISLIFENIKNNYIKNKYLNNELVVDIGLILSNDEIVLLRKYSFDYNILNEYFNYLNDERTIKNLPYYWIDLLNLELIIIRYRQ